MNKINEKPPVKMTTQEKSAFRRKKEWKDFSKQFLKDNPKCVFCGAKATLVHHKYESDYTLLEPQRFLALCNSDHRMAHRISQKKNLSPVINKMKLLLQEIDFGEWVKF